MLLSLENIDFTVFSSIIYKPVVSVWYMDIAGTRQGQGREKQGKAGTNRLNRAPAGLAGSAVKWSSSNGVRRHWSSSF